MEDQQTVDYIKKHMAGGHSEENLRQHFLSYGWSQDKVDDAFVQYRQSLAAEPPVAKPKRRPRVSKRQRVKAGIIAAVLIVLGGGIYLWFTSIAPKTVPPPVRKLTYQEKQTIDVNTLAGAVSQFTYANGSLPDRLAVVPNTNTLVLCDSACAPGTSQVSPLTVYKAVSAKIMPYASNLTAPDQYTIYMVPGAKCASSSKIGEPNPKPRSMIILYAVLSGTSLTQRCVTL